MNFKEFENSILDISKELPVHPKKEITKRNPEEIDKIIFHCTAQSWDVWQVAEYDLHPNHIDKEGCPCITYSYFIEKDGTVYKCLEPEVKSWHVGKWNATSLGFCINFEALPETFPPKIQFQNAILLASYLSIKFKIETKNILGHRELAETGFYYENNEKILRKECPGISINLDKFRAEVERIKLKWLSQKSDAI